MSSRKTTCALLLYLALQLGEMLPLAAPASACTGPQFVSRRTALHCDKHITYAEVAADPASYAGKVLELRGTVGGTVTTPEGRLSIMLNMEDKSAVMLDVPAGDVADVREFTTPQLRVLVEVKDGVLGNVVPLKTLAVVHESEISAEETVEQARQDAARKKADWKRREQERWQATVDRALRRRAVDAAPSRGSVARNMDISEISGAASSTIVGLSARTQPLYGPYYRFISHRNPRLNQTQLAQITFHLLNFADRNNVDPRLVVSMIIAESDFDPHATSRTGAKGLGQLMPETSRDLGVNNPYDVVQNLAGSINYLRTRLDTFGRQAGPNGTYDFEQVRLAMAAYNAGEGAVKKYGGVPPYRETQAYVKRVTGIYQQLCR